MANYQEVVIGMDVGGTWIKGALFDPLTWDKVPDSERQVHTEAERGVIKVTKKIGKVIADLSKQARPAKIIAAGIGSPGVINEETGEIEGSAENIPGAKGHSFTGSLQRKFRFPLFAGNDAKFFGLGEAKKGAGRGMKNFAGLTLGTGIGGFQVVNGQIYFGAHSKGGELGRLIIIPDGPACNNGCQGSIESLVGKAAILERWKKIEAQRSRTALITDYHPDKGADVKEIFIEAEKEAGYAPDIRKLSVCYKVVEETAGYLAAGIRQIIIFADPEAVILGGKIASEQFFIDLVQQKTREMISDFYKDNVKVLRAEYPDEAGNAWRCRLRL